MATYNPAVDIDTASSDELQTLPGVGKKVAEAIVHIRDSEGRMTRELLTQIPHFREFEGFWSMVRFSKSETEKSEGKTEVTMKEQVDDDIEAIQRLTTVIDQARLSGPPSAPVDSFKSRESGARLRY
jgi:transcriptional accessory protein Tex/SPT6